MDAFTIIPMTFKVTQEDDDRLVVVVEAMEEVKGVAAKGAVRFLNWNCVVFPEKAILVKGGHGFMKDSLFNALCEAVPTAIREQKPEKAKTVKDLIGLTGEFQVKVESDPDFLDLELPF